MKRHFRFRSEDRIFIARMFILGTLLLSFSPSGFAQPKPDGLKGVLSGRVVDDDDHPVTDAEIQLQGNTHYFRAQTDRDGTYSFLDAIPAGEYRLGIKSDKWVGITDYRQMPRINIDPEHPFEKNFVLERACRVEVKVVNESGVPIPATVYWRPLTDKRFRNAESTESNAEGIANLGGLVPSNRKYIVGVTSKSHSLAKAIIEVADPDDVTKRTVVLRTGKPVRGRALCSDGLPAAGWMIYAIPTWWNFGGYPAGAKIGDDGTFELPHIGDHNFNLSISIPTGNGIWTSHPVLNDANLLQMDQPIDVRLDYPSPESVNYLTGKIRWIGRPLDVPLRISGYCAQLGHHTSHHLKPGQTEFRMGPVPKGTYRIRIEHPEIEVMNLRKIKNLDDLDHVRIPNEEPLQLALRVRDKPHLQGSVVDATTQEPIAKFRYRVSKIRTLSGAHYEQDDDWVAAEDATGRFQLDVVGPGIYQVSVLADGYAMQSSPHVNTEEEPDRVLKLELKSGFSIKGRVVDVRGEPVEGATVRALSLASGAMPRVLDRFLTTEGAVRTRHGQFELRNLEPGFESIRVDHPEFAFKELKDVPVGPEREPLTIVVSKGATIQGTVYDVNGKPQANETLVFRDNYAYGGGDREAGTFGTAVTDEYGQYKKEFLPETTVYVSRVETWTSSGMVQHAVRTTEGETHDLNIGGTTRLSGQFFVNDQPLNGVRLQLGGEDSMFGAMKMFVRTDDEGRFCFFGAPPGHWNLYRALDDRGTEWVKVRALDVAADSGLDLGEIRSRTGSLTVECETDADELPENLVMHLQHYYAMFYFGRAAAMPHPRDAPGDPFVFAGVSPGDYELSRRGAGDSTIVQRLTLSSEQLDSTIKFRIPHGRESLVVELVGEDGEALADPFMLVSDDRRLLVNLYPQPDQAKPGEFKTTGLPAGSYTLRRGIARNADVVAQVNVKAGEENRLSLRLPRQHVASIGVARLLVTDENGVITPCTVTFQEQPGDAVQQHRVHRAVNFMGKPGRHRFRIDHPGFESVDDEIELERLPPGSETSEKWIRLRRLKPEVR